MRTSSSKHLFIVGSPRSGTTLLQSLLASHSEITSFPESHFFKYLVFKQRRWSLTLGALGIAPLGAKPRFKEFLHEINQEQMQSILPSFALFSRQYAHAFVKVLDTLTKQQGKTIWIEKTPGHLYCINSIEKLVPDAKFIHILRNGMDVVASQYEVTHKYPEIWGGARDVDECVERWIKDVKISQSYVNRPNHILVRYEKLLEDPQLMLTRICQFVGTDFDELMLQKYSNTYKRLVLSNEAWKASVKESIRSTNSKKFYEIFEEKQQSYILDRLQHISIDELSV